MFIFSRLYSIDTMVQKNQNQSELAKIKVFHTGNFEELQKILEKDLNRRLENIIQYLSIIEKRRSLA